MLKPIRIIDREFNLLGEIDDYESLIWTRRWHKAGEFELYININKQNTHTLQKENIVLFGDKAGIIRHREMVIDESGKGGETLLIIGSSLSSLVGRRITIPPAGKAYDIINSDSETVIKHYVDINCINPVDIKRKIPNLVIADNKNRGANLKYQSRLKQLDEELEKISITSGLGWAISIDIENKQFVFDAMEGKDLTSNQTRNNPVIFSIDFDNVKGQIYIDSDVGHKNQAYVGGQGEGVDRSIVEVGEELQGLDRHEVFVDARDIENDEDLHDRGQQKLLEMQQLQSFESKIDHDSTFKYKQDWDLGDIVTVQNKKWGVTLDSRIIEITEIYEPDGFELEATFGNTIPTLVDKIKRDLDIPLIEKGEGGGVNSWKDIEDKPEEYPPSDHNHKVEDVGIEIGGRNLIRNSDFKEGNSRWTGQSGGGVFNGVTVILTNGSSIYQGTNVGTNEQTTASIRAKGTGGIRARWGGAESTSYQQVSENYDLYVFNIPRDGNANIIFEANANSEVEIEWVKLEKGNIATDWTPAPEDIISRIEAIEQHLDL